MQSSTVVTRTDAGRAELATPAHGLSLTQRRFLTLLDTSCTVDELAVRYPAEERKFARDLTRLAELGLVACDAPVPANDATAARSPLPVRLGAPGLVRWLPLILLPLAAALAWVGWHPWAQPAGDPAERPASADVVPATPHERDAAAPADPQPIATRVLKSDAADRARDAAKESRIQPKGVERRPDSDPAPSPLRVEHRSPPHENAEQADAPRVPAPALPERLTPLPVTPSVHVERLPAPAFAPPIHVAAAAPASAAPRPAPSPALVAITRESPSFPREAIAQGLADGNVRARLTIDARGSVSNVDIVDASHRAFTRAVREALLRWRFEPGTAGRTTTVDVAFKRD